MTCCSEKRATTEYCQIANAPKDPSKCFVSKQLDCRFHIGQRWVQIPSRKPSLPSPPLPPVPPSTPERDKSQRNGSLAHKEAISHSSKGFDNTRKRFTLPVSPGCPNHDNTNFRSRVSSWVVGDDTETQVDVGSPGPSIHSNADTVIVHENDQYNQQDEGDQDRPLQRSPKASTNLYQSLIQTQSCPQRSSTIPEQGRLIYRKPVPSSQKPFRPRRFSYLEKYRSSSAPLTAEICVSVPLLIRSPPTTPTEAFCQHDGDMDAAGCASSVLPQSFMDFESDDDENERSSAVPGIFPALSRHIKNHHKTTRLRRSFSSATSTLRSVVLCGG